MKLNQIKLLTDENISPKVVASLRQMGIDVLDTKEQKWFGKDDEVLLDIACQQHRFVLTHDSDFGTLAINQKKLCYGILYLRPKNLSSNYVTQMCHDLFQEEMEVVPYTILVIEEKRIRIRHLIKDE